MKTRYIVAKQRRNGKREAIDEVDTKLEAEKTVKALSSFRVGGPYFIEEVKEND